MLLGANSRYNFTKNMINHRLFKNMLIAWVRVVDWLHFYGRSFSWSALCNGSDRICLSGESTSNNSHWIFFIVTNCLRALHAEITEICVPIKKQQSKHCFMEGTGSFWVCFQEDMVPMVLPPCFWYPYTLLLKPSCQRTVTLDHESSSYLWAVAA